MEEPGKTLSQVTWRLEIAIVFEIEVSSAYWAKCGMTFFANASTVSV
jgi:hypothetical protein